MIFMIVGIITVCCAPLVWWKLDSDIMSARFLTPEEKEQCIERVRANQTGTGSKEFKWSHIIELLYDPKTYLFGGLSLCANFGATVATAFGPTLLRDTGFSKEQAALLNAPFGALQTCTILFGSYLAQRLKLRGICLIIMMTPVLIGTILLYVGNVQEVRNTKMALAGYYMLAPLWSANPLIVSWMISNTGGQTKKSGIVSRSRFHYKVISLIV
jgi:predicted MFS family arabinose efflux permease